MTPLYRIDMGKDVYYALDDFQRVTILQRLVKDKPNAKPNVLRAVVKVWAAIRYNYVKPLWRLRDTRRLVQLTIEREKQAWACQLLDILLAEKRAADRRNWLENTRQFGSGWKL